MKSVTIVGSGVAGTVLARQLLGAGGDTQITMLEAGPGFEPGSYRVWLDHLMAGTDPYRAFWDHPRTEHEEFGLRGSRLFVKGGTTNHWGGETPRFKPEDFELKSRTGRGADWPIGYDELSPHYARAESLLGVAGDSGDDDPPRHGLTYPFPAAPYTLGNMPMIETLEKLGIAYSHMPVARNGDKCVTTGTCDYCPVNARYTASYDLMLLQSEYGSRLAVRTEAPAVGILMDGARRVAGVRFLDRRTGAEERLESDAVIVSSGTFESAKLLLASITRDWPEGVGNASGHVGRHLVGHPLVSVAGVRPGNPEKLDQELVGIVTLLSRHFDTPEYQREGKLLFTMSDRSTTVFEREILANVSRPEIEARMTSELPLSIGGSFEQFESPENRVRLGAGTTRHGLATTEIDFGVSETTKKAHEAHAQRLTRVLEAAGCKRDGIRAWLGKPDGAHATSTCRMSRSDADGVVDADLRVHGTDNLYVCSNAVFPNVTAANPTLTVAALAARLGEHLATGPS